MTNKQLKGLFDIINRRFFDCRLSKSYSVRFEDTGKDEGYHIKGDKIIRIHSDFRAHSDIAIMILLHEMAHADLPDYIGWTCDEVHGLRFKAKLDELYKMGAYDEIL